MYSSNKTNLIKKETEILKKGGLGVLMTDTLYGILGSALNKKTVAKIYKIKGRDKNKPFIILISSINDLKKFSIKLSPSDHSLISKFWPGKVSIVLPLKATSYKSRRFQSGSRPLRASGLQANLRYLHRGTNSLAFRLPDDKRLISIIKKTGPLVAPSANPQGKKPASSIIMAKKYFGDKIDFYEDRGVVKKTKPSTLIKIVGNKVVVLRK